MNLSICFPISSSSLHLFKVKRARLCGLSIGFCGTWASAATRLRRWDLISLDSGILSSGGTIPLPRIHVLRGNGLKSFKVLVGE